MLNNRIGPRNVELIITYISKHNIAVAVLWKLFQMNIDCVSDFIFLSPEHFVDKYRCILIERVSNIAPILDDLLHKRVINQEVYERIRHFTTSQDKIRELYCTGLKGGKACKDAFFQSLEINELYLIDELKTATGS